MKKRLLKIFSGILAAAVFTVSAAGSLLAQPGVIPDWSTLSSWAESDIKEAYELGILQADMARDFQTELTREQFCDACVMVLSLWFGCDFRETENVPELKAIADKADFQGFSDTSVWYVEFCAKLGIVNGIGGGTFAPDSSITREQAARMLYNTLEIGTDIISEAEADNENGVNGIFLPHVFADGREIDSWARNEIYTVYNLGIMTGDTQNNFSPLGTYTREAAYCTFLRLYKAEASPDELNAPEAALYPSAENKIYYSPSLDYYYLNDPYNLSVDNINYEPVYYDGYGNSYTAAEKGYVYPVGNDYMEVVVSDGDPSDIANRESIFIDKDKNQVTAAEPDDNSDSPKFLNNLCVVENRDNSFSVVNTEGEAVKSFTLDLDKYYVWSIFGTNMILQTSEDSENVTYVLYKADTDEYIGSDSGYLTMDFNSIGGITACKSIDSSVKDSLKLENSSRDIYLYDNRGNFIKNLRSLGYSEIKEEKTGGYYQVFKINESSNSRIMPYDIMDYDGNIIKTGVTNYSLTLNADGITAYEDGNTIRIFDSKGSDLGAVAVNEDITRFGFINGLLNIQTKGGCYYYTPFGEEAIKKAWTVKE